ncbi:MAG: hypothetical protein KDK24_10025 [Pseudooceanicola sp.]|nr:hypothetical protein [Pseudooceanicola sp.]
MERISTSDATAEQLRAFATMMLGLEIDGRWQAPKILEAMVKGGYTADTIPLVQSQTGPAPRVLRAGEVAPSKVVSTKAKDGSTYDRRFYLINVHTNDGPGGQEPVPVGVNGRIMFIERGKPQEVPEEYVAALKNAVMDVYPAYTEGMGGLGEPQKVQMYPFSYEAA